MTLRIFGLEFLHFEASTDAAEDTEAGDCTTTPMGFVARFDQPDEVALPDRGYV